MSSSDAPLYVRLPKREADALERAKDEFRTTKRALIVDMVQRQLESRLEADGREISDRGRHDFRAPEAPEVLTAEQAAELLQVDQETVVELAEKGELPARRVGPEWRFARAALLAWLAGGQGGGG